MCTTTRTFQGICHSARRSNNVVCLLIRPVSFRTPSANPTEITANHMDISEFRQILHRSLFPMFELRWAIENELCSQTSRIRNHRLGILNHTSQSMMFLRIKTTIIMSQGEFDQKKSRSAILQLRNNASNTGRCTQVKAVPHIARSSRTTTSDNLRRNQGLTACANLKIIRTKGLRGDLFEISFDEFPLGIESLT